MQCCRLICRDRWRTLAVPLIALCLLHFWSAAAAPAQDFDRYRPNPPASRPHVPNLPAPPDAPVGGSTDELVSALRGVMILDDTSRVQDPIAPFDGVRIDPLADLTVAREEQFKRIIQPYLGQPISIRSLNEMARGMVQLYQNYKQPVVDVSMPPGQDITDGVVQVVITESRIGNIRFDGNCWFDDCLLGQQSWLRPGQRIYEPCLQNELIWYNQNPFRDVRVELEPGRHPGTTDIVYKVQDEKPIRWYSGYEDSGVRQTSLERLIFGFNWGNAWGKDRQLSYQYTADAELGGTLGVHSFVYQVPIIENRDTWTVFGSWGDIDVTTNGVRSEGTSWQLSGRYRHTLCRTKCQVDQLQLGFDTKGTDNLIDFGIPTVSNPDTEVHIVNMTMGVSSQQQYSDGTTAYACDLFASPGYLLSRNTNEDFRSLRSNSKAHYAYVRSWIERVYNIDCRRDFVVRATGQLATNRLLATEQLGFGGYRTLRGYDMRIVNGDAGYILNLEYRSKPILGCCNGKETSLTMLAFSDIGQQFNYGNDPNLPYDEFLASVGVGFRYMIDPTCTLRFDYGVPLTRVGAPVTVPQDSAGRVHVGAVFAY
jgi:hemolysin activation/secretion protein